MGRLSATRGKRIFHPFGVGFAARVTQTDGVPRRTLQEWMGHRDFKTTLIYADYAPAAHETEMAERAFARGTNRGTNLSESASNSEPENPSKQAQSAPS